jgi:hypothetical protein
MKAVAHGQHTVVAHRQSLHLEYRRAGGPRLAVLLGAHLKRAHWDVAHLREYRNDEGSVREAAKAATPEVRAW